MRVLIVSECYPTEQYPLLGLFELDQARALAAAGVEVIFFAIDLRTIRRRRKLGIQKGYENGVEWYSLSVPVGTFLYEVQCPVGKLALYYLYKKVFKNREAPDIIHAHFTDMGCISSYLSKKTGIPLIITEHSSLINRPDIGWRLKKVAKQGYYAAKQVIAVSDALANNIKLHIGVDCIVIPNIIDLAIFCGSNKIRHSGFNIVTTCNLIPIKRVDLVIKAFSSFASSISINDTYLYIIGDGYLKPELERLCDNIGIGNQVIFCGLKSRKDIAEIYRFCDCFIMLSERETFGVAYVEAMASGLPVIASRCGGPEGFVNENNGIIVDKDNEKDVVTTISRIYSKQLSFSEQRIRQTTLRFSSGEISKSLIKTYRNII